MRNRNDRNSYQGMGRSSQQGQQGYEDQGGRTSRGRAQNWGPQGSERDFGYGSTQESRDFRNQREDRYEGALDFGSHAFQPRHPSPSTSQRFGRAPKGFKRSDERIKEEICEMIMRDESIDASDVEIEVSSGEVTLTGTVPERKMKHAVEDLIEATLGVSDIHNQIKVKREESASASTASASQSATDREGDLERSSGKGLSAKKSASTASATQNPQH